MGGGVAWGTSEVNELSTIHLFSALIPKSATLARLACKSVLVMLREVINDFCA